MPGISISGIKKNNNMKNKIYIGALAVLLVCLSACNNRPLPYTFLIPANYKGILRVIFDEECGIKPGVANGRQILAFGEDGILILNSESFNGGMTEKNTNVNNDVNETKSFLADMKSEYYLVDGKGNKTKITQILNAGEKLNDTPSILPGETTVSGYTYHNSEVEVKGITYQDFYLYNSNATGTKETMSSQQINTITKALVNACRTSH